MQLLFVMYEPSEFQGHTLNCGVTAVAKWLRCCATDRKVAGSIPAGVSGFDIKSFQSHCGPGVNCNRNKYQEYFLGVKLVGV